jgi:hypothetical protein
MHRQQPPLSGRTPDSTPPQYKINCPEENDKVQRGLSRGSASYHPRNSVIPVRVSAKIQASDRDETSCIIAIKSGLGSLLKHALDRV